MKNRYPYSRGDNWSAREANAVIKAVRAEMGGNPPPRDEQQTLLTSHIELAPFSVFGLGSDTANPYDDPPIVRINDPVEESKSPYFTDGGYGIGVDGSNWFEAVLTVPRKIRVAEEIAAGDMCAPDESGAAVVDDSGELLAVTDSTAIGSDAYAFFVWSPMGGDTNQIRVEITGAGVTTDACGMWFVRAIKKIFDEAMCQWISTGAPFVVYLAAPCYVIGEMPDAEKHGIAPGNEFDCHYDPNFRGGSYVTYECIFTGERNLESFANCMQEFDAGFGEGFQ